MYDPNANTEALRAALSAGETAYHAYRNGRATLHDVFDALKGLLDGMEQFRLEYPHDVPHLLFLNRYDVYEAAAVAAYNLGYVREAFDYAERARALTLLDRTLNKLPLDSKQLAGRGLLTEEAALGQQIRDLTRRRQRATLDDVEVALRRARAKLQAVREEIRQRDPAFASLRGVSPATADDARALLERGSALLAYCVTEERLLIFVVTNRGLHSEHVDIRRAELSRLIRRYRERIEQFMTRPRVRLLEADCESAAPLPAESLEDSELSGVSRELYDILIRPAEAHLRSKSELGIVLHDDLRLLPFHALNDGRAYLIERYAVWYAPSVSLLDLCFQRHRRSEGRVLAIGAPDLGNPRLTLPFAEQEVNTIALLFGTEAYVGSRANLSVLREQWKQCDILHVACHAYFDAERPEQSALLLTPGAEDTGRIEAQELFTLGYDLPINQVTLSACQTSLGAGSDLTGLATGFLYAGASAIVASLWSVDDFSTGELMVSFYRELTTGGRAAALREAQLKLLRSPEHAHPYFWAGFQLIGAPLRMESERTQLVSTFNMMPRWSYLSEKGTLSHPAVAGETLYATWSETPRDGEAASPWQLETRARAICAISLTERRLRWRRESGYQSCQAHCWVPGLVHVNSAPKLRALREADGEVVWEHELGGAVLHSLSCDGERLYVGGSTSLVQALEPSTGEVGWRFELPRPASGGFAVGGDMVFVGCKDHRLYALDASDGRLRWACDLGWEEWGHGDAWVSDGRLLTAAGAFDIETGGRAREAGVDEEAKVVSGGRLVLEQTRALPLRQVLNFRESYLYLDEDLAFFVDAGADQSLYFSVFDAADGELLRRYRVGRLGGRDFCRAGELVILSGGDGSLNCFSVEKAKRKKG